jgi:hypothetical protein
MIFSSETSVDFKRIEGLYISGVSALHVLLKFELNYVHVNKRRLDLNSLLFSLIIRKANLSRYHDRKIRMRQFTQASDYCRLLLQLAKPLPGGTMTIVTLCMKIIF